MVSDPIADLCTRIRNAYMSRKSKILVPDSKLKYEMSKILAAEGYISKVQKNKDALLEIDLKYGEDKDPVLTHIERVSKPGLRIYKNVNKLPKVLSGLGIAIISTSKGLMTDKNARKLNLGGEVLCQIW